jgi:hypothetical protein
MRGMVSSILMQGVHAGFDRGVIKKNGADFV